ncbi:MAG: PD-(D/E)XK nuclease family protein, partial [Gammaproteobacteria bacterium]|nr:PD-(D/E)XK nuclease family protein [Gammaproteobacteria bacterium]
QQQLPDLSQINIFIPNSIAADQLKQQLGKQLNNTAFISPYIGSLNNWINNHIPLPDKTLQVISQQSRQLLFLHAIRQHPKLFKAENHWQVTDALLKLFDELTANNIFDPSITEDQLNNILLDAYGCPSIRVQNLKIEATIIHTLWKAWHEQMQGMNILDEPTAYATKLQSTVSLNADTQFYIAGFEQLSHSEKNWCMNNSSTLNFEYISENAPPGIENQFLPESNNLDSSSSNIDILFDNSLSLKQRCDSITNIKELSAKIDIYSANSYEQEAQAIELQTRLWLLENKQSIAIISEDRKIARRVRALLDRAGIIIQDTAGWALSTTSASTVIERWLECIEEDFPHQSLLDLIKSPFFAASENRAQHLEQVYHFEHDIVIHENIARDLQRFQIALVNRKHKLGNWPDTRFNAISDLLQSIKDASSELKQLHSSNKIFQPEIFLRALVTSLDKLNIISSLGNDRAGKSILSEIEKMIASIEIEDLKISWPDFRTWLASSLENQQLKLNTDDSAVKLMNFKQAQYCSFDAIIIAGANREKLPGKAEQTAFFNQTVKATLGLAHWKQKKNYTHYQFKCLLKSASDIFISYCNEHNGEWLAASPWVTSIEDVFKIADINTSHNTKINDLIKQDSTITNTLFRENTHITEQPLTPVPDQLRPGHYSPNSLQKIINCPYQFFTTVALSLKAPEHISEELRKSEYGEKVHAILHTFHQSHKSINASNKNQAIDELTQLSGKIFRQNIEDNIQHRSWFERWSKTIPFYIDWQIKWQKDWSIHQLESDHSIDIYEQLQLQGRTDRVDRSNDKLAIIDYKTGTAPGKGKIINGED